jgi:hypothetical protein
MKALRLSEVLLPLLAARGWAPWPIEPGVRRRGTARKAPQPAPARQPSWRGRHHPDCIYDDVQ